jgi:4-hydroxy-tetrahydrodipicolinate synthase
MTRSSVTLGGSMTAVITPFRNGTVDDTGFVRLCEHQIAGGTTALIVCGSTGEAAAMSPEEQVAVVGLASATANGRIPIVAGCQAPATAAAIRLAGLLAHAGADALLCAPPPYVKPTQQGIMCHMRALAHGADRPLIFYDVPGRVGVGIADATVATLFERGIILGLKDATADVARVPRLRALCGEGFWQLSGDDATAAAHRAMGGHGCISVTANLTPALCSLLHRSWDAGDLTAFASVRDLLAPLHAALFVESNPIPLKAALAMRDLTANELRLPLTRASAATLEQLAEILPAIMTAEDALAARLRYAVAA